jgi:hypothetical protein
MPDRPQILGFQTDSRRRRRECAETATLGDGSVGSFRNARRPRSPGEERDPIPAQGSRRVVAAVAFLARLDRDLEDRFLQKSSASQRRVRVLREEDREVTGRNRKPDRGDIIVKLDVPLLVKYSNRSLTH